MGRIRGSLDGGQTPSLHTWRVLRALNRAELARLAGVGQSTIGRAELGRAVGFASIRQLAKALNTTTEHLMRDDPVRTPEDLEALALAEREMVLEPLRQRARALSTVA